MAQTCDYAPEVQLWSWILRLYAQSAKFVSFHFEDLQHLLSDLRCGRQLQKQGSVPTFFRFPEIWSLDLWPRFSGPWVSVPALVGS